VSRFDKLFGLDVILVHRLLKNAVEERQYVLMTAPAYDAFGRFFDLIPEVRREDVDGFGLTETYAFHGDRLASVIEAHLEYDARPTWLDRMLWRLRLRWSELLRGRWRPGLASSTGRGKKLLGWTLLLLGLLVLSGIDKVLEAAAVGLLPEWALTL
jgi:hypothetical protein